MRPKSEVKDSFFDGWLWESKAELKDRVRRGLRRIKKRRNVGDVAQSITTSDDRQEKNPITAFFGSDGLIWAWIGVVQHDLRICQFHSLILNGR